MKIPKKIHLGGHKIPVEIGRTDSDAVGEFHHGNWWGIIVSEDAGQPLREETFFHEVIEAINHLYELELPHHKIQTIGAALHQSLGPHFK